MNIFLPPMTSELGRKFDRMIDLALPESKAMPADLSAVWSAEFFGVAKTSYWLSLAKDAQEKFLFENSQALLTEALLIEHAGVAYGHHMALQAETQQERHYYTTIATEELQHLRWLKPYCAWTAQDGIPSFPQMVADLILTEKRSTLFLMIQVLLEGWGIQHYTRLMQGTNHPGLRQVFANILFDESRHHAGGLLLFEGTTSAELEQMRPLIQSLLNCIRIGPYRITLSLGRLTGVRGATAWTDVFNSLDAVTLSCEKIDILHRTLAKAVEADFIESLNWEPLTTKQMADFLCANEENLKIPNSATDSDL